MKTFQLRIFLLPVWAAILAVLVVAGTHPAAGQASKQILSVPTLADLEARTPATGETVEVRNGSSSNLWSAPRLFVHQTSSETADRVYVVTNRTAGTRYIATDRGSSVKDVSIFGAIGDGVTDDTAALQSAASLATAGSTLYSPAGKTYLTTNTLYLTNDRVRLDFSGSTIKFNATTRKAAVSAGPAVAVVTGMDFALSSTTNKATGVTAGTFAAGDMVMLYNDVQSPANYNPGQFAFVESASGTEIVLDRFPDSALQVTNAYRFVNTPDAVVIRNLVVDLSGAADGTGISVIGRGHLVENCRVIGTGTTNDPNYIGIELRGQSITARKNFVQGILDAGNATDRSGYGIFATGDNITVENNELLDCKHCVSTSERKAISHEIKVTNNRIRQRDDWAGLTDVNGSYLFTAALDVHANVRHIEFRGNDVKIGGRYALSLRNDNFDVLFNRIEVTAQTLPFAQHTIGLAEEMVERGLFHGNQFITADGATLLYFAQADSGVSGTHSNLSFVANSFKNCILSLDDFDTTAAVTNGFANTVIAGNTFNRPGGTTLLFSGPSSNAIVTGNAFTHGGSGVSVAVPGDDTTNPAREIYIAGNTFNRTSGTSGDVRVLSGPTNIIELGNNRFSDVPTQGFDGQVAISRTPPSSYRFQLITADDDELLFNSTVGSNPARLKWGGTGALLGNDTEFVSSRTLATDRAFASWHTDTNGWPFVDQYQFVIKADGLMSWSDGDNAAQIVLGPRRNADVTNGVIRLSGGLGLSERAEPITPSATTATLWLEEADSSKSLKIKWPDGSNTVLYPQSGNVNVMDFGAVGDGSTDDTAAIQAAIDSLPLPATNSLFVERGGSVFIPAGTYKITAPLRMRPGKIEGASRFGTVLINHGLTNDVIACMTPSNTPPTGIWLYRVAHMSIHQADATVPTAGAAIRVQSDDNATASMADVEDVFIHGTFRGFHGSALQGSSLKTLTVYATKDDGILWDVYQTMVQAIGCWTYYCGQNGTGHGWHLQGPAYCTVSASGADSNYGWGWYVESGTVQAPRGNHFTVGAEQNRDGGILIKNAIGGVYSPMVVTPDDLPTAADGIVVDNGRMVGLVGAFTQQGAIGGTGYPLRITNSLPDYPSVTVSASYLNSYNTGSEYHQTIGIGTYLPWEERGFIGLNTDGKPRRMLDVHDRTGTAGNTTGHELARLALHTSDTNGNASVSLSPDGEASFFKVIVNNPSSNTVFNVGTNADVVFHAPGAPLSGDGGSFLFQIGGTPVMTLKGGDTLGAMGLGIMRPNPAALLDVRSSRRGILLPSWEATEFASGLYGSGQYTPPGLLAYDSDARSVRVQTRNADDGLTNNQYTTLFGYVDRDLRLGTAHRLVGTIFPQSVNATDTNIGSVYLSFTAEGTAGLELEQNSLRAGPYKYGTFGDTIIRNSYTNNAGAYGNLLLMAGDNASVTIGNGTDRGLVTVETNLFVTGAITAKESADPATPAAGKATIWLEEADTSKSLKIKWPDGSNTALYPQAGGGTNSWKIEINSAEVIEPDLTDTSTVQWTAVGPLVSGAVKTNSLGTNYLTGAAYAAMKDLSTATGTLAGSQVGTNVNDDNVSFDDADNLWTATTIGPALEELNDSINAGSPNGTGAKVHWSQLLGVPAGFADGTDDGTGGGGNADTNAANAWGALQTFNGGIDAPGTNELGVIHVVGIESDSPLDQSIGATGGTNAESARVALGLQPDVDILAFYLSLKQIAQAMLADGDVPYRNADGVMTNTPSTAAGRALLAAADALAQWNILLPHAATNGAYNATSWDGVTNKFPTLDQFKDALNALPGGSNAITDVTSPLILSNGVLSLDTNGLGGGSGGGGGGVTWLANDGPSAYVGLNTTTNWPMASFTISSNDVPVDVGKFVFGYVAGVISNASGSTISVEYNVDVNGVRVFRDLYQPSTSSSRGKLYAANFMLIRESSNTASFVQMGPASSASNPGTGYAGDVGLGGQAFSVVATNIAVDWSSNVTLGLKWECTTTTLGSPTNAMAGFTKVGSALLKYNEASGLSGDGSAITNLNASNLASGTVPTNRLDSSITGKQDGDSDLSDLASSGSTGGNAFVRADSPTVTGTWHFDSFTANSMTVLSNLYAISVAYGPAWDGSTNVTTRDSVYDEMELRAPKASPTLASPTLNDMVTFEQTTLSAHSSVTNFVVDPTVSPYQVINSGLTSSFAAVGFLHATNVAAGRQTTVLVFAGTNATVTVSLAAQFARNTNSVALTAGQVLPISFYGYGSNPTNVVATMGTPYSR